MRSIYLIRHGKTEANKQRLYYGSTDVSLCEEGIAELKQLRNQYADIQNCAFITSGMARTEQTLTLLFGEVPHGKDARFREMDFGSFEMRGYEQLKELPEYQTWICGDNEANITPGGESGQQMRQRVLEAFSERLDSDRDVVLIIHGGPIAAIMAHLFPEENKNRYSWQPGSGCGYRLQHDGSNWRYFPLGSQKEV